MRGDESCDEDTEDVDAGDDVDKRVEVGGRMPGHVETQPPAPGGGAPPASGRQDWGCHDQCRTRH